MYGDAASPVFRIAKDVWDKGIWQAEVEYFLPVQMCHMRVNEKYRVWHDFCHHDDARMAKTDINHIDGYTQGTSTLCKYQPGDLVPGLNVVDGTMRGTMTCVWNPRQARPIYLPWLVRTLVPIGTRLP